MRILFVDDDTDFLESVAFWLKSRGHEVLTAKDGPSAIENLNGNPIDVVFLDYRMAPWDGIETLEKIRELNRELPVVMVTANPEEVKIFQKPELNISGFFSKIGPFRNIEGLLEVVLRRMKKL